ncbi:Ribosomal L18 c domain-containing protein [Citrus sinensis]|nr:Ribosomal L18 c domain-containing protein [Citrus sinensis]
MYQHQCSQFYNPCVDILIGGDMFSDPLSELVTRNIVPEGATCLISWTNLLSNIMSSKQSCFTWPSFPTNIVSAIGVENSDDSVLNFWNITRIREGCSGARFLTTLGRSAVAENAAYNAWNEVGTTKDSTPVLSPLAPLNSGLKQSYRRAPPSTTTVEFVFVLGILMSVGLSCLLVLMAILWLHSNGQISSVSILRSFNLEEQFSNLQFRIARETVAFTLVPSEAEILTDYDLVLEQYLPPSSPLLAGFCVDAFSAIKPGVAHSPSSDSDIWDKSNIDYRRLEPERQCTSTFHDRCSPAEFHSSFLGMLQHLQLNLRNKDDSGLRAALVAAGLFMVLGFIYQSSLCSCTPWPSLLPSPFSYNSKVRAMAFVKAQKSKAYFKRFQVKYKRRREGKTDYRARIRLINQDKNKYNTPKYRFVVRFTNKDIIAQIVSANIVGDSVLAAAYAHELPRYGLEVGLTNYAAAYCTGLLLARRVLKMLEMDDEYEGNVEATGEDYSVEPADTRRPFRALLDVGLIKTTTGNRVFGALKGALDGGLDIPHSDKRFAGFSKDGKQLDAEVHRKYIYGGHVAAYMSTLMEDEPEKYQSHFTEYIKKGIDADGLEALYKKVHAAIRADPTMKKSEKPAPKEHKRYNLKKLTYEERKAKLVERLNALNSAVDEEDE